MSRQTVADVEQAFTKALTRLPDLHAMTPHDDLVRMLATSYAGSLGRNQMANYLAIAVVSLLDEQAVVAKTLDNWDVMSEARAERYRLAWVSARGRAQTHFDALVEADEERDALRALLRDREDEVAELVVRLAEYSGLAS